MRVAVVRFESDLITVDAGKGKHVLHADFNARVFFDGGEEEWIRVPMGFVTDFASVPRLPGAYLLFGGRANKSAVLHDFLYVQRRDREFADAVFLAAMKNEEPAWRRFFMWLGVRIGGWTAYVDQPAKDEPWRDA
jgi:hypothetical protein